METKDWDTKSEEGKRQAEEEQREQMGMSPHSVLTLFLFSF